MFVDSREPRQHSHDLRWHICVRFWTTMRKCWFFTVVFEPAGTVSRLTQ